jgi:signal transduction histidine kinase
MATEIDESSRPSQMLGHVLGILARRANLETRSLDEILKSITETAAKTLAVARVNIWLYEEDRSAIRCIEGYDVRSDRHEQGEVLLATEFPSYFRALDLLRTIAAMDAEHDSRTEELTKIYLEPHGISTMLDVPLLRSGIVIGVICHEHRGPFREWTERDRMFAGSVGDLVSMVLETENRARLERERAVLSERLQRMERLEGLSWLAASIAHDFRNLLTAVFAHAQVLETELPFGPLMNSAHDILDAAQRARDLCDQLLVYSGKRPASVGEVVVSDIVSEILRVQSARIPANVRVELDITPRLPPVLGEATEVHRALMNLVVNALDALRGKGGLLRISVREDDSSRPSGDDAYDFRVRTGPALLVEVADTGVGITPEAQRHLFQPFFTTKADGHGFGLPTVLGTVRGHAGALAVQSAPGEGTTFSIWLPYAPRS